MSASKNCESKGTQFCGSEVESELENQIECEDESEIEFESETEFELELENDVEFEDGIDTESDVENRTESGHELSEIESELEIEKDKKSRKEKIIDGIIKAFTVKRRQALIDLEDSDNVDYETSEKRLIFLASILAILFVTISTVLSSILVHQWSNSNSIIIRHPMTPKESGSRHLIPHLALLFNDGLMEIFEFSSSNDHLKHSWTFKVPAQLAPPLHPGFSPSYNKLGYIMLISQGTIMIIYSEGRKDMTIIESNQHHHTIPHSKIPRSLYYIPRFVQVNNQVWMFGGLTDVYNIGYHEDCQMNVSMPKLMTRQSLIWNLERQVYYPGPKLPNKALGRGCPIPLNRTDVLLLYIDDQTYKVEGFHSLHFTFHSLQSYCLKAWVFSFEDFKWNHMDSCIYQLPTLLSSLHFDLMCTSLLDKLGKLMILAVLDGKDTSWDECSTEFLDLVHLDYNSQIISRIQHNFTYTSNFSHYFIIYFKRTKTILFRSFKHISKSRTILSFDLSISGPN